MKKILAMVLLMMLVVVTLTGCGKTAEHAAAPAETQEEVSKFEQFLLKKGALITKEFVAFKSLKCNWGSSTYDVDFEIATLTNVETSEQYKALRIVFEAFNGRDFTEEIIALDAEEVDSLITAFQYMHKAVEENTLKDYTEIMYVTNSGAEFVLVYDGGKPQVQFSNDSNYMFYDASNINRFIDTLNECKTQLNLSPAAV